MIYTMWRKDKIRFKNLYLVAKRLKVINYNQ